MPVRLRIPDLGGATSVVRGTPWWFKPLAVVLGLLLVLLAIVFVIVAIPVAILVGALFLGFRAAVRAFAPPRVATTMGSGTPSDPEILDADDPARQNVRVRRPAGE